LIIIKSEFWCNKKQNKEGCQNNDHTT
jgi:hypothetical protein